MLGAVALCGAGVWFFRPAETVPPAPAAPAAQVAADDAGDARATTSFDGPLVHRRAAVAIHPVTGADPRHVARELRSAATGAGVGALTESTFAVFSAELLGYLVPELTVVLPEGTTVVEAEAFMRDHRPADVGFYVVEPVLVHDLTFAVVPAAGVAPAAVRDAEDREGVLSDSLNHYETTVQAAGLTVRYFGAILSDGQVLAVREAMARAAHVTPERVGVEAGEPGPGVDLGTGTPDPGAAPHRHG
ncbi:hypothetical protein GCM10010435_22680 [Winogradskya consettensis]|uniref:Uncharacterized protein n=1 Tax=Winogradskya consettensis TaxID=113560 RepID=A0A919T5N6_9ACTN|nr:hypothetical protein Aco04nite_95390 [Actinoplanes consettensis]